MVQLLASRNSLDSSFRVFLYGFFQTIFKWNFQFWFTVKKQQLKMFVVAPLSGSFIIQSFAFPSKPYFLTWQNKSVWTLELILFQFYSTNLKYHEVLATTTSTSHIYDSYVKYFSAIEIWKSNKYWDATVNNNHDIKSLNTLHSIFCITWIVIYFNFGHSGWQGPTLTHYVIYAILVPSNINSRLCWHSCVFKPAYWAAKNIGPNHMVWSKYPRFLILSWEKEYLQTKRLLTDCSFIFWLDADTRISITFL